MPAPKKPYEMTPEEFRAHIEATSKKGQGRYWSLDEAGKKQYLDEAFANVSSPEGRKAIDDQWKQIYPPQPGDLADDAKNKIDTGGNAALERFGRADLSLNDMLKNLSGPGYREQLYEKRLAGQDQDWIEHWQRLSKQGTDKIGQGNAAAFSAHSGRNEIQQGAFKGQLGGEYAQQMAGLAGGAQSDKQSRYDQMFSSALGLGASQSDIDRWKSELGADYGYRGGIDQLTFNAQKREHDQSRELWPLKEIVLPAVGVGLSALTSQTNKSETPVAGLGPGYSSHMTSYDNGPSQRRRRSYNSGF